MNSSHAKNFRDHVNWPKDVDDVCGESYADRIVGGEIAKLGQYPWMAQLELVQTTECISFDNLLFLRFLLDL